MERIAELLHDAVTQYAQRKRGIQNYLWDDLFVGWTCGMLISFDVCCGTDLWDCTMLKGNRF